MPRTCLGTLLAASLVATTALAQDSAYSDALGHAQHGYYAGRLIEAHSELNLLIQTGVADARAYYFRGLCAWQLGRAADAQRDFARGAELEQADPDHLSEVSAGLTRVQGAARRSLESYRATARLTMTRQRDAQRLAHYGLGLNQPPIEHVAANTRPAAPARSADELPMQPAAPAAATGEKPAEDPFAAPAATAKPAAPAEDPFAAPAEPPAKPMSPAAGDTASAPAGSGVPAAPSAEPAKESPPAETAPPVATPAASAPTADASTPDATIATAIAGLDDPQKLWPLLPATYQADVKGLVNEFGGKMDAELWNRAFAVLKKLVKVGKDKRDLILKQPMLAAVPGAAASWDPVMDGLDALFSSDISTVEGLKTLDPGAFLAGAGGKFVKVLANSAQTVDVGSAKLSPAELKAAKISTVKSEGDTATVAVAVEGKPPVEVAMKRVDGKWLPATMVDGWAANFGAAKLSLDKMNIEPQKAQGMMMLQMADGVLDQLLAAQDEAAFNAALGPIIGMVLSQMGNKSPLGGPMPGGAMPGGPPPGFPGGALPGVPAGTPDVPGVPPPTKAP